MKECGKLHGSEAEGEGLSLSQSVFRNLAKPLYELGPRAPSMGPV